MIHESRMWVTVTYKVTHPNPDMTMVEIMEQADQTMRKVMQYIPTQVREHFSISEVRAEPIKDK